VYQSYFGPHNLSDQQCGDGPECGLVYGISNPRKSGWRVGSLYCNCAHVCFCMYVFVYFYYPDFFPMFFLSCGICPSLLLPSFSWSSCLQYYAVYSSICFFVFCCVFIILCGNWITEVSVNSKIIVCCKRKMSFSLNFSILWQWMFRLWCAGVWHHVGQLCAFSPLLSMCVQIWKHCLCNVSVLYLECGFVRFSVAICKYDWIEYK
jgi:hypothetical protein